jgi:DNA-binding IclR family transcriptional regulator
VGAPKSSVYGFVRGLLAVSWLFEQDHRLYLGPACYGLTMASGHIRPGTVSAADLDTLYRETGLTTFLGVRAADQLICVAEAGSDVTAAPGGRPGARRDLLTTAGGKALLAALPETEVRAYLRRRPPEEQPHVEAFLDARPSIKESGIAVNVNQRRSRTGVATVIRGPSGQAVALITLAGPTSEVLPRLEKLSVLLRERVQQWRERSTAAPKNGTGKPIKEDRNL